MRHGLVGPVLLLLSATPCFAQEAAGISTPVLPSCLAGVSLDERRTSADAAYGAVALDGLPWLKVGDIEKKKAGSQKPALRVVGTGTWWLLDGTALPLRFVCLIDHSGRPTKVQANPQLPSEGNTLPPHSLVAGTVASVPGVPMSGDSELRIQLFDLSASPAAVLAEQVVHASQPGPIPFALRLVPGAAQAGRELAINAIVVQQGGGQLRLKQPRPLTGADLKAPISLVVE